MKSNLIEKGKEQLESKEAMHAAVKQAAYWWFALVYLELLLHIPAFGMSEWNFGYVLGFSGVFACILALIMSCLKGKLQFTVMFIVTLLFTVFYGSQLIYSAAFGTLYAVAHIQLGGEAITSFWKETLLTIWNHLIWILLLFVPLIGLWLTRKYRSGWFVKTNGTWRGILAIAAAALQLITMGCLQLGDGEIYSNHYFYYSDTATTDQTTERFGLLTAFRLDISGHANEESEEEPNDYFVPTEATEPTTIPSTTEPTQGGSNSVYLPPVEYNVLNIDFDALNTMTDSETRLALNAYIDSLEGTNKNRYTGMLKDYNLIVLCAEAFSTAAIQEELTPTLYRLANEGIVFTNYYNTYPNNTIDGEYTLCMGLYPDASRGKDASSFYASRYSLLPFSLGNLFKNQRGIQSYGYHNYYGGYYGREESHPNLGYTMKFAGNGMNFPTDWPSSDLEMMQQSVDDYISAEEQFHAYYMTFSGHMSYDVNVNPMAARNWDLVKDLDYSDPAKCYLSCNLELEKALTYLMQRLEEAGIADKTAIVLAADHFPYGLQEEEYAELVDYELDDFSKYKSTLIFWVGGLEETIVVDEYCCNADILPTILNLWGFDYDSRMLAGTDVFSLGTHVAILRDMSFLTDKVWVNASTGEIRYLVNKATLPKNYVEDMARLVDTKFSVSEDILDSGYYRFVFEQGAAAVQLPENGT